MYLRGYVYYSRIPGSNKRRPVLVISPDARNQFANSVIVLPITGTARGGPWHVPLKKGQSGLTKNSVVQAENIVTIPKDWLAPKPLGGPLSAELMGRVRQALLVALDFD